MGGIRQFDAPDVRTGRGKARLGKRGEGVFTGGDGHALAARRPAVYQQIDKDIVAGLRAID